MVLFVLLGFVLQFRWMEQAKKKGMTDVMPAGFASKLSRWMMSKKGISPDSLEASGAEKISCETCMGSGIRMVDDGQEGICLICQGVGFRMVRRFDPADRICTACGGMGRLRLPDSGEVGTCPRCDGRGLIRSPAQSAAAPNED